MRVLLARCAPCDQAQYFASLTRLLHPAQPTGRPAAGEHEPFQDRDERVVSGHLLLRVAELSEDRPLLVAVDDAHLADPASRRWLVEAARHVDRMPVLLLVTERSQYDIAPPTPGLAHTLPPDLVRTHTLAPLSGRSTALLARGRVGDAAWPRVESRVRASAGHPLLLHALLEDLGGSGAEAVPESSAMLYPGAYQAAVSWWLESAGPRTTAVARALAVLEDTWADIPGRPAAPASPHGSVRPGAPAHPATVRHLAEILTGMTGADPPGSPAGSPPRPDSACSAPTRGAAPAGPTGCCGTRCSRAGPGPAPGRAPRGRRRHVAARRQHRRRRTATAAGRRGEPPLGRERPAGRGARGRP